MANTRKYLQELYRQSLENVRDDFGTKGAFVILALKVCLTAIGIGLFAGLQLLSDNEPVYKIVFAIFASDIIGLFALWIITPFIAIGRIPKVAASNYQKQKDRLEEIDPDLQKIVVTEINNAPWDKYVGINIRNLTEDEFDGVIEIIDIATYEMDKHCNEHLFMNNYDKGNCHFHLPKIKGVDHASINLAELRYTTNNVGNKFFSFVLLTETPSPLLAIDMLFVTPAGEMEPEHKKLFCSIDFEIRGKLGKVITSSRHNALITFQATLRNPQIASEAFINFENRIDSHIEIGEITREYKKDPT